MYLNGSSPVLTRLQFEPLYHKQGEGYVYHKQEVDYMYHEQGVAYM